MLQVFFLILEIDERKVVPLRYMTLIHDVVFEEKEMNIKCLWQVGFSCVSYILFFIFVEYIYMRYRSTHTHTHNLNRLRAHFKCKFAIFNTRPNTEKESGSRLSE